MEKKKSQMEIMGLVVIVILITLGMFFVVRFMITKQPSEIKKSYTRTEIAANILNSLLKTNAKDCYGMTTTQLLQDCAVNKDTPTNQVKCENDQNSLEYVQIIIETIFNETLISWGNQSFDLKIYIDTNNNNVMDEEERILQHTNQGCSGEKEAKQSYIPTDVGIMTINLEVC